MKQLLQNHPNYYDFPVKSWKVALNMVKEREPLLSPLFGLFCIVIVLFTLLMVALSFVTLLAFLNNPNINHVIYYYWGATIILLVINILIFTYIVTIPKREQLRYYKQAGLKPLSLEQRQALQLVSISDFSDGFWTETLEYYSLKKRVKHDHYIYRSLPLIEAKVYQSQVYSDWEIGTKSEYTKIMNQLWKGMHSQDFKSAMNQDHEVTEMVENLATLILTPTHYIMECIKPRNKRPPALLWGFDLWRAIMLSRNCFCADIISEEQAWQDILKTASYVHGIFDSLDEFTTNYRLGNAFWSNSSSMACDRLAAHKLYQKKCHWPIKSLDWPDVNKGKLPPCVADSNIESRV